MVVDLLIPAARTASGLPLSPPLRRRSRPPSTAMKAAAKKASAAKEGRPATAAVGMASPLHIGKPSAEDSSTFQPAQNLPSWGRKP